MGANYMKLDIEDIELSSLGKAIYNESIEGNIDSRDKLLDEFLNKTKEELGKIYYKFDIEILKPSFKTHVPKLLIHTNIVDVKDVTRVFYILREYFMIQGNLRLTNEPYYFKEDGDVGYFKTDESNLTLVLDFVEYKCNELYRESMINF